MIYGVRELAPFCILASKDGVKRFAGISMGTEQRYILLAGWQSRW
jgi:hypothetical protein